ncbi:MAG: M15 family metallopeptidase [Acidimicrobiales bacterium]
MVSKVFVAVLTLVASACTTTVASDAPATTVAADPLATGSQPRTEVALETTSTTTPEPTIKGGVPVAVLATDTGGSARVQATPFALRERNLSTTDLLSPPPDDGVFRWTVSPIDDATLARSTWDEECPVSPDELSYVTVSFIGFDSKPHTGELILHSDYAEEVAAIFGELFERRFPIEEMRIVEPADLTPPHWGDTNNTSSFVCRKVTGGTRFSEHASGLALDINPFHNPYVKSLTVIPALAGSFGDRSWQRTGMINVDDPVVAAFERIGWKWGGNWNSLKDYQHFSHNGR